MKDARHVDYDITEPLSVLFLPFLEPMTSYLVTIGTDSPYPQQNMWRG